MLEKYLSEINKLKDISCNRLVADIEKVGKYVLSNERKLLNLSSNDYLGLAENKEILSDFYSRFQLPMGSASARLLTGTTSSYKKLESYLANAFQKEGALLFNSGYHANVGLISSLLDSKDVLFMDKLNHASMVDGLKLSGTNFYRYKHLDYEHLENLLEKHRNDYETAIIASESVFSMDGDIADLEKLVELKNKYNAILLLDEAHAFGVFGENGLGLAEVQNLLNEVDIIVATFGKSIGSVGAFVVGKSVLIDYLTNKARSFIFSTALPEANIVFSKFVLENILPHTLDLRKNLLKTASIFRNLIQQRGLNTLGASQIVPVILGENEIAVKVSSELQNSGYYVLPIRHPTVPVNTARLRLSLRADISLDEIRNIPEIISGILN
ncbi:MAG: 8-amino-7-oxononanoate synthase [Candidatus Gastranaerophilales bacterium]|nr:8-amino-7-oxononanoate synthase [Candidatus Gastranaerophilales bacterium]